MSATIVRQCPHMPLHPHLQHSPGGGKLNTVIWGSDGMAGVSFLPLLNFHRCNSNAAWATEKKVGCQKIKRLRRRFGLRLQGSATEEGLMAASEPRRWPVYLALKDATAQGLAGVAQSSMWYRTHVSAVILVGVHADRVPREQLETSLPFLPFSRSINIESITNPPPPSQTSSPLPNSSSSKDEIEPCHSGNPFPLALGCESVRPGSLWSCVSSLWYLSKVIQVIISISVLGPWAPGEHRSDPVPSTRPGLA